MIINGIRTLAFIESSAMFTPAINTAFEIPRVRTSENILNTSYNSDGLFYVQRHDITLIGAGCNTKHLAEGHIESVKS